MKSQWDQILLKNPYRCKLFFKCIVYIIGCRDLDIAFALDSSVSVGNSDWRKLLRFVQSFVSELTIGEYDNHVGVVTFGSESDVEIHLDDYLLKTSLMAAIGRLEWKSYGTNTAGKIMYFA